MRINFIWKSNFMIISSQSKVSNLNIQTSTLNLDGKVLHQIDNISYFGIHFNERLCRKPHVNKLYMKLGKKTKKCYGSNISVSHFMLVISVSHFMLVFY